MARHEAYALAGTLVFALAIIVCAIALGYELQRSRRIGGRR